MEQDSLALLRDIKFSLNFIVAGVTIAVIVSVLRFWRITRDGYHEAIGKAFKILAEEYLDKGEFEKLIKDCEEKLVDRPNHLYALWYLGKAHYSMKAYEKARVPFEKIISIEPGWDKGHVRPYLDKIDAEKPWD